VKWFNKGGRGAQGGWTKLRREKEPRGSKKKDKSGSAGTFSRGSLGKINLQEIKEDRGPRVIERFLDLDERDEGDGETRKNPTNLSFLQEQLTDSERDTTKNQR